MIVNEIYCGCFNQPIQLTDIDKKLKSISHKKYNYRKCQPNMISLKVFDNEHINIYHPHRFIFFTKGTMNTIKFLNKVFNHDFITKATLKSITASFNLNKKINLSELENVCYEPELFPAAFIKRPPSIHINIFSSGKVVIVGMRNANELNALISLVENVISYKEKQKT